jgi:CheY-like chemotaxis protein
LLAGRKLLLADDSITIQKVVDLTFADEGVNVLCVSNGKDAIDRIEDFRPDVVLADVFMPQVNGYEVCEFIKQNEKLKHIPVMLLVGSFEPFDEAEARRVGADDTLTKPFQSIRSLLDKVGLLVRGRQPEREAPTAELPKPELSPEPEPETLSEDEIEITTADTQPLPPELGHDTLEWAAPTEEDLAPADSKPDAASMETKITEMPEQVSQEHADESPKGSLLLDLDDYPGSTSDSADEFLLDVDLDEVPEASPIESAFPTAEFVRQAQHKARVANWNNLSQVAVADESPTATPDQLATTQEFERPGFAGAQESALNTTAPDAPILETQAQTTPAESIVQNPTVTEASLQNLPPEVIDAIARRAVEQLSEKVVQEIAWEVVPQLAELLIKRQLEEKNS